MENQTRFDLNTAIANWQQELAAQSNLMPDVRRELETHLSDSIAELRQRDLNDEESFWLARRRVGQPKQLGEEFAKADPVGIWRERVFWMVAALFLYLSWARISFGATWILFRYLHSEPFYPGYTQPMMLVNTLGQLVPACIIAVLFASGRIPRMTSTLSPLFQTRMRLASATAAIATAGIAFEDIVIRLQLNQSHGSFPGLVWAQWNSLIWLFGLVVLLVWLMPTRAPVKPKKTKTA